MAYADVRVEDVMSSPPITVGEDATVYQAAVIMAENNIGSLIVVDENGSLLGIVTERDIVRKVVAKAADPRKVRVGEIMSRNPYYVTSDDSIVRAAEIMGEHGIGHLPVLDPQSLRVVGMISKRDIVSIAPDLLLTAYGKP
ncbi:MAG: CBS domain-containing protein [Desulfurococcales archaeon]|nr:CBS domain-containing protein [Desulfurococcales archaeon]